MSGEYWGYIAGAYGIAALVLMGVTAQSFAAWRRIKKDIEEMDDEEPGGEDA